MKKKILDRLARILDDEINDFKQLLKYEKLKNEVIIKQEIDQLKKLTEDEEAILDEVAELEKEREKVVESLFKEFNTNSDKVLSDLIKKLPSDTDEYKEDLKKKKNELIRNIKDLKHLNVINNKLLMDSIKFFSYAVNSIKEMDTVTYNHDGSMPKDNSWLINKQA